MAGWRLGDFLPFPRGLATPPRASRPQVICLGLAHPCRPTEGQMAGPWPLGRLKLQP
uniref:Uncharacterized protein n=1 Tax=Triticum urartu TaxID=4572 RepID=A0A8R7P6C0_TRIUA